MFVAYSIPYFCKVIDGYSIYFCVLRGGPMGRDKKKHLQDEYYRSFLMLIVIPIFAVIFIAIIIIRTMLTDSAVENIRRAQDNLVSTLSSEVKDTALRLSHLVHVNDNGMIRMAVQSDVPDASKRYHYTSLLAEEFDYMMAPQQDIVSAAFYMKDGEQVFLKEDILIPVEELRAQNWYQEALGDQNVVKIGYYDRQIGQSVQSGKRFVIAAALAPGIDVDRSRKLEMVMLFANSRIANMMREYDRDPILGTTVLIDGDGQVVLDVSGGSSLLPGTEDLSWMKEEQFQRKLQGKEHVYIVTTDEVTGLSFVTVVSALTLTRRFNQVAVGILTVTCLLFALFYVFSRYFLQQIIHPLHGVVEGMKLVEEGNLEIQVEPEGQEELQIMGRSFNHMVGRIKGLLLENERQQQKKHEAEIQALQSQINPHFLVNSLSSIKFIAQVSHFDAISRMAEALMKILTCSFRSSSGFYTFGEELEVLDGFIYLMQIRYSDGFEIVYDVEDECRTCLVPRLILQPVVENSIVHGFSEMMDDIGCIRLKASIAEEMLEIVVEDNGKGMEEAAMRRLLGQDVEEGKVQTVKEQAGKEKAADSYRSIGVSNVNTRLILNYGAESGLKMESVPGEYTRTIIRIPVVRKAEDS